MLGLYQNDTGSIPSLRSGSMQEREQGAQQVLHTSAQKLDALEKVVHMADPQRILDLGFSLTLKDGHPITDAEKLMKGDRVVTLLKNGKVESEIKEIHNNK